MRELDFPMRSTRKYNLRRSSNGRVFDIFFKFNDDDISVDRSNDDDDDDDDDDDNDDDGDDNDDDSSDGNKSREKGSILSIKVEMVSEKEIF